jgi:Malectin domain
MRIVSATSLLAATLALIVLSNTAATAEIGSRQLSSFSSFWKWLDRYIGIGRTKVTRSATVSPVRSPVSSVVFHPIRINCGGSEYTDSKGKTWSTDAYFNEGQATKSYFAFLFGVKDATVFHSYRTATKKRPLKYSIPVPAGSYSVSLYFSNPMSSEFNIYLQNKRAFSSGQVGAKGSTGTKLTVPVRVDNNGSIDITFEVLLRWRTRHRCVPLPWRSRRRLYLAHLWHQFGQERTDSDGASRTVVKLFRVACTLPSGSGTVDVQLTLGATTVTFPKSYRYIVV